MNTQSKKANIPQIILELVALIGGAALFTWVMTWLFSGEGVRAWW